MRSVWRHRNGVPLNRRQVASDRGSWIAEYGDPDDAADWAYLREFSPYHNVRPMPPYPPALFITSTRDDRVHPGHARKMAALLRQHGHDVAYYENLDGGHGAAADNEHSATICALTLEFLWRKILSGSDRQVRPDAAKGGSYHLKDRVLGLP